jgi:hypothetical protein
MDDYNTSVLSEAKNEYSANLVNILAPLFIQGLQSIFTEACSLCKDNDEYGKYLMTFQNFLTRVPKWNQEIIENETKRVIQQSKCSYLEDLLTCVHITQLKVLTSIRVATKQKKIDINIPKLSDFIHKVYIKCARKCYSNVYLFETDIAPLTQQKNLRECELICKECILNTIRESMPIEKILRAYMDETTEEEVVEEEIVVPVEETVEKPADLQDAISAEVKEEIKKVSDAIKGINKEVVEEQSENITMEVEDTIKDLEQKLNTAPVEPVKAVVKAVVDAVEPVKVDLELTKTNIKFSDTDSVVNYDRTASPTNNPIPETIAAPKTIERLEQISHIRNEQRKLDEADDEDEEDKLTIFSESPSLKLDALDIQVLDNTLSLKPPPLLTGVETL